MKESDNEKRDASKEALKLSDRQRKYEIPKLLRSFLDRLQNLPEYQLAEKPHYDSYDRVTSNFKLQDSNYEVEYSEYANQKGFKSLMINKTPLTDDGHSASVSFSEQFTIDVEDTRDNYVRYCRFDKNGFPINMSGNNIINLLKARQILKSLPSLVSEPKLTQSELVENVTEVIELYRDFLSEVREFRKKLVTEYFRTPTIPNMFDFYISEKGIFEFCYETSWRSERLVLTHLGADYKEQVFLSTWLYPRTERPMEGTIRYRKLPDNPLSVQGAIIQRNTPSAVVHARNFLDKFK
ncbi:hypothetical protein A3B39_02185 [Candidatus Daviesbacteria bacterium RIFCSPLOWO2_01_FULL_37_10]|nr:MAG: hypothetical protein A3B39_02185 [Candidatus Daviesbacteria bacterium RIFCSPLOWO2_01_FULL_37_10]